MRLGPHVQPTDVDHQQLDPRHVKVKGRAKWVVTITVTRKEMLYEFNQGEKSVLGIVLVGEDDEAERPHYNIQRPFDCEPGPRVSPICFDLR
jgi:hypothetical protein